MHGLRAFEAHPKKTDLIIIPGVAFDYKKHRIGYGKGFYDRWLEKNKCRDTQSCSHMKIALAFDFQILKDIPFDKKDVFVDIIITEKNIVY